MKLIKALGSRPEGNQGRVATWGLYLCECGEQHEARIANVRKGGTKSCGCKRYGTHGLSNHPIYGIWLDIKKRCNNKNSASYESYGGRGIVICDRWNNSFPAFLKDMGERPSMKHSVDRIDNDGNYSKDNCRWATKTEQNNNTRKNLFLSAYGVTQTVAEWARTLETSADRIYKRLSTGWSDHDALFTGKKELRSDNVWSVEDE